MKKKLEGELISIAHRVLKLKNRSETIQLQEEAKKLYEQLTILRFYEENIELVEKEIDAEKFEQVLGALDVNLNSEPEVDTLETKDIVAEFAEEIEEPIADFEETVEAIVEEVEEEEIQEETQVTEFKEVTEQVQPQAALFDDVFAASYKDIDFVKVEDVPAEVEKVAETTFEKVEEVVEPVAEEVVEQVEEIKEEVKEEIVIQKTPEVVFEEPRTISLNDRLNKGGINIGLNDRIAFEKKLFNGSTDDYNRVLSQLNTFDSFEEAKGFIEDFVKPDYDNWNGKEEFETRFLEFVEKKFN